jgi:RNA polymerase sigma-70 factor (ECF subfamily)
MQDAMQDAYLAAYKGLAAFRGDCSLETWLHRITYTTCLRPLGRRPTGTVQIEAVEQECTTPDHADQVVARRDLAAALGALPLEQRVAVLLVDRHGFSYRAAADVLGVPPGTVASRLSHGRAALRAALDISQEEGENP